MLLLANCKRFDVYLTPCVPKELVARALCLQKAWCRSDLWALARRLCMALDDAEAVVQGPPVDVEQEAEALSKRLELRRGEEAAIYGCEVAMALEQRTRRG